MKNKIRFILTSVFIAAFTLTIGLFVVLPDDAIACTRILWNTNSELIIVGRNEDYVTASHSTLVVTPRGVKRLDTSDDARKSNSNYWTVKYGNVSSYANNRFPNHGMNEAGLTTRTLFYIDGKPNEIVVPDSKKFELYEGSLGKLCA